MKATPDSVLGLQGADLKAVKVQDLQAQTVIHEAPRNGILGSAATAEAFCVSSGSYTCCLLATPETQTRIQDRAGGERERWPAAAVLCRS